MVLSRFSLQAMASSSYDHFSVLHRLLLLLLSLPLFADSVSFKVDRFQPNGNNLLYQGDAVPEVGTVRFNNDEYLCRVGWVVFADAVPIWDSDTGKLTDFSTHFTFSIDTRGAAVGAYGHGIAFFLAPSGFQIPPNSAGGFLGLFNTTNSDSPLNQIVHVEFDSFLNEWDPQFQHVGINNNSISSSNFTSWNASLHSGDHTDVWVSYKSITKTLSVSWAYQKTSNPLENTTLIYHIDLTKALTQWVTVGISGATGAFIERNTLLSWEFNSTLDINPTSKSKGHKVSIIVGVTVSVGVLILMAITAFTVLQRLKRKQKTETRNPEEANLTSMNDDLERGAGPRRFSRKLLATATNNFSNERKLGEGGFGEVYRGYISEIDLTVAVKKISRNSKQGRRQYITEVKVISRLRHRNLVQLIGWCHDKGEFLLVYEFMPNGSLDTHLFGRKTPLSWPLRYKIALGLASGLLYLHEEWEQCVIHRDIKSSNVMLDSNFNVKLGDFGLARLMDHELGAQTTGLVGTLGYLAPEYIGTGRASKESDVFSFGVVALEIVTGKVSRDSMETESHKGLVEWVWDLYGSGQLLKGVDEKLQGDYEQKQVECLMLVGLWSSYPDPNMRPSIRQAIQVLKFETTMPSLPGKMPVAVYQAPSSSMSSNEPSITVSLDLGR